MTSATTLLDVLGCHTKSPKCWPWDRHGDLSICGSKKPRREGNPAGSPALLEQAHELRNPFQET